MPTRIPLLALAVLLLTACGGDIPSWPDGGRWKIRGGTGAPLRIVGWVP